MIGWKKEAFKFSDYCHDRIFGDSKEIIEVSRDISSVPIIYQGQENTCVDCAVAWIEQFIESNVALSEKYLAKKSGTESDGIMPSKVLETARLDGVCEVQYWLTDLMDENAANHKIKAYAYIENLTPANISNAIARDPVMIGVDDLNGSGNHMLAGFECTKDGVHCVNWWDVNLNTVFIPYNQITFCASILREKPNKLTMSFLSVLKSKWMNVSLPYKVLTVSILLLTLLFGGTKTYGAAGAYARFQTTLSRGLDSSSQTVYLSSLTLQSGESIGQAGDTLSFPLYLTIKSRIPEDIECWTLATGTTPVATCVRGISYLSGRATTTVSTLAVAHTAGEQVIMSNTPAFYNRILDYVDARYGVGGTFADTNIDATKGLIGNGGVPVKVGISLGGGSLSFDSNGALSNALTGTAGENINNLAAIVATSSGSYYMTDTSNIYETFKFVGFAVTTSTETTLVSIATPGMKVCGFKGLDSGAYYYLNGASGSVSSSPPVIGSGIVMNARVAMSLSSTCLQVIQPSYLYSDDLGVEFNTPDHTEYSILTGFFPARIESRYGIDVVCGVGCREGIHQSIATIFPQGNGSGENIAMVLNTSSTALSDTIQFSSDYMWYVATSTDSAQSSNAVAKSFTKNGFVIETLKTRATLNGRYWVYSE